ncbi:MAG: type IV pilus modification protein PilV [Burkholderiaceae bacterium]|nr:MAG: type IV pilus modification protein PilV [Burkholderiaceae bacterium]
MINTTPRHHRGTQKTQAGVMLLEALVAILIFSVGILGIVKLQATSIQQSSAAEYRTIASMMANDVISQMWVSDKTPATLKTNFESAGGGTAYTQWQSQVIASGLPGVSATQNAPTIAITGGTASSQAVVTVFWKAPFEADVRRFTAIAQIK